MIATITLNPSIDKLYVVDDIEIGKVMRVKFRKNSAGGKGLNVSRVAVLLREPVVATGIIGGHTGRYFEELAKMDKIQVDFVESPEETRCCINVRDLRSGRNTEFLESGSTIDKSTLDLFTKKLEQILKKCQVVTISGSIPPGVPSDYYQGIIKLVKSQSKKVLLDTSGSALKEGIKANPTLVKPNQEELTHIFGANIKSRDDVLNCARLLHNGGIEQVVVSMGANGVLVVNDEGTFVGIPPKIEAVNTVGCGDSLVAGFAVAYIRHLETTEGIRLAVTAATANAMSLETGSFKEEDFKELITKVIVQRI
ncbi:MAG: 1-phosphofructokinase [Deltaproteobacteria bacterium]|jgi:tagatose 6-phosphate kinase|nr:1-phosphofructokinase [Deltaproteobacteria bacterium]